jgi:hypothetical protein
MRDMPIGIQDFEKLRTGNYVYVDKTEYVYQLARLSTPFFLGRPRRFGKSLLLSTLKAYFEGKRELFQGLAMERQEKSWIRYPVLHIDLNVKAYEGIDDLYTGININLKQYERQLGIVPDETDLSARFYDLIRTACDKSGQKVVVLVDEYDRPLLQTIENKEIRDEVRNTLKGFYGVLKSADPWLRFVLLTGVTKFSKVSVFSDLNMLRDISMNPQYAGICGISARELEENFKPELEELAEKNNMTYEEAVTETKKCYDGYHFAKHSEGMFNPFSVLNTLADSTFAYYWFQTGTPTFLVELIKRDGFDPLQFAEGVDISGETINDYRADGNNPVSLLYQSGYLTIVGYDRELDKYTLDFPNEEVRYGFLKELLPAYLSLPADQLGFFIQKFLEDLRAGNVDGFMDRLKSLLAGIPYDLNKTAEYHYQLIFYLVFTLMGQYTRAEVRGAKGRTDLVVFTVDTVYVFEFKLDGSTEAALAQIDDRGYGIPYEAGDRKVVKIAAVFDSKERNLSQWAFS